MASILEFSLAHALEEVQVFFDSSFPKRAVASRFGEGSPVFTDLIRTQAVDIGLASTDQDTGEFVECLKIIGGMGQSLVAKLIKLRMLNQSWRSYRSSMIAENKWRAIKDGIKGELIDFGKQTEISASELTEELIELIDDVLDPLGTREDVEYLFTLLKEGSSADRQISCYERTDSLEAVVDQLSEETMMDC